MSRKHSIAMVAACPFPANYGSPAAIRELAIALAGRGHDIHIVTYPHGDDMPLGSAKLHRVCFGKNSRRISVGPSLDKPLLDFLLLLKLCRVIREEGIEIIHAHNYEGQLIGIAAKLLTRKPLIYNAVNLMSDELPTYRFIRPAFIAKAVARLLDRIAPIAADEIIALTPEIRDTLLSVGCRHERMSVVPCGIYPEIFDNANPEALRKRYHLDWKRVILYAGVHSAFQRVDYLLRAFQLVREHDPSTVLMLVSPIDDKADREANQSLARRLGIADHIILAGPHTLEELPSYLALADVAVVPRCDCPGHPIKLLNYMAAAKPIVCFTGAAKGIRHNHDALLVPDHDWHRLGDGILRLLRDPELATRLAHNARETAVRDFDWRQLAQKVEHVYDSLVPSPIVATADCAPKNLPIHHQPS